MIYIILLLKIEMKKKEIVKNQNKNNENDYINFNDFVPCHYIGKKSDIVM